MTQLTQEQLTQEQDYENLVAGCVAHLQDIRRHDNRAWIARWRTGKYIRDWMINTPYQDRYGKNFVEKLAADISGRNYHIGPHGLYVWARLVVEYPTLESLEARFAEIESQGNAVCTRYLLPAEHEDPAMSGGPANQLERELSRVTRHTTALKELTHARMPDEQKQQIAGIIQPLLADILDIAATVDTPKPEIVPQSVERIQMSPDDWTPSEIQAYEEWIRSLPCAACGDSPSENAHFPFTKGAGAKPYETIPLCHDCHINKQHTEGFKTWLEEYQYSLWRSMHLMKGNLFSQWRQE